MRLRITPGATLSGEARVPGDKSIAHRWLILAGTADGSSRLAGLPLSLDARSTASCVAALVPKARASLDLWTRGARAMLEGGRSTWNGDGPDAADPVVEVEAEGRSALVMPEGRLECGNSGTSMRLLAGVLAGTSLRATLTGDASLSARPMERVASPLRAMGAQIETTDGHAPLTIVGRPLVGVRFESPVPSAQVKGAVLLAGLSADGETTVVEPAPTRDHTERALRALGAPLADGEGITVSRFQHEGFAGRVPGDPSSAAFLVAAAALTGSEITVRDVGLNPTRLHYLDVMARMGIDVELTIEREELGEPVGSMWVRPPQELRPARVEPVELPLVIDEVPVLAVLAAHAHGDSWFLGAGELRVKESDRLAAIAEGIRSLGGHAAEEGDDLVLAGGGLGGGTARSGGDHRMAMSLAIGALAADAPCEVAEAEASDVSFPGFAAVLVSLGATIEETS